MPFNLPLKKSTPSTPRRPSSPTAPHAPPAPPQRNISELSTASSTCSTSTSASETSSLEAAPIRPPAGQLSADGAASPNGGGYGYGHGRAFGFGYGYGSRSTLAYGDSDGDQGAGEEVRRSRSSAFARPDPINTDSTITQYTTRPREDSSTSSITTSAKQRVSIHALHSPTNPSFSFSQPTSRESSTARSPVTPRAGTRAQSVFPGKYHTYAQPYLQGDGTTINASTGISGLVADPEAQHLFMGELRTSSSGPDLAELRRRAAEERSASIDAVVAEERGRGALDHRGRARNGNNDGTRETRKEGSGSSGETGLVIPHHGLARVRSPSSTALTNGGTTTSVPSPQLSIDGPSRDNTQSQHRSVSSARNTTDSKAGIPASMSGSAKIEPRKAVGLQDFLFGEVIGRGSYSTVILATQKATALPYAIKILDQYQLVQEKKTKYAKIERDALVRLGPMAISPTIRSATTAVHPNGVASARASRRGSETSEASGGGGLGGSAKPSEAGHGAAVKAHLSRLGNTSRLGQSSSMPGSKRSQPAEVQGKAVNVTSGTVGVARQRSVSGATLTPGMGGAESVNTEGRTTPNPNLVIHIPDAGTSSTGKNTNAEDGSTGDRLQVPLSPLVNAATPDLDAPYGKLSSSQTTLVPADQRSISPVSSVPSPCIRKPKKRPRSSHPGVVRLHYTFKDDTSLYFVLDLAINGELLSVIKKHGSFDVDSAKRYAAQLIDTIEFMHERGVIHRDLKPENILLDDDMRIKVTDFGSAKVLDLSELPINKALQNDKLADGPDKEKQEDTRKRSFVGTAEYVSPEVLRNEHASFASDIWAFGCILFQMLAGRPPFRAATEYLTFQQILKADYEFPEGIDEQAKDLIQHILKLDPSERLDIDSIKAHPYFDGIDFGRIWTDFMPEVHTGIKSPAQTTTSSFAWDELVGDQPGSSENGMQSADNISGTSGTREQVIQDDDYLEAPRRRWIEHGGGVGTFSSGSGTTDDNVSLVGGAGLASKANSKEEGELQPAGDKSMLPHGRSSIQWSSEERRNKWSEHLVEGEDIIYQSPILLRSGLLLPKRRTLALTSLPRLICVKEDATNGTIKVQAECLFERDNLTAVREQDDRLEANDKDGLARKRLVKKFYEKGPRAFAVQTGEKERVFITDRDDIRTRWMEELDKIKPRAT